MFLSCCCPSGRKENKKRKTSSGGGQSSCPSSPHYQPHYRAHYQAHSPIFTIQSQPTNIQSDSLSSEDFYYYQVALLSSLSDRAIVIHHIVRMSTSSPKTRWSETSPSFRPLASTPEPATSPSSTPPVISGPWSRSRDQRNPALPRPCPGPEAEEGCPARYSPVRRTSSCQSGASVNLSPLAVE